METVKINEYPLLKTGKVREIYDLGDNLLFVATDRISAFDSILPTLIPDKGKVLAGLSEFWFSFFGDKVKNHYVTGDVCKMYPKLAPYKEYLDGRAMVVKKAQIFPVECVVRGYLAGSAFAEYKKSGTVCGKKMPDGLLECSELPEPIFTPSTKADAGHDENIDFDRMADIVGFEAASKLRDLSLYIYSRASAYAKEKGIIIADTKFEFGSCDGEIILCDEVLTPDSSRFWPADQYCPGKSQPSFDKQYVRDYLNAIKWNHEPPAPPLPPEVVTETRNKYMKALELLSK
ncbi:phosphoribosylaminoimidazolesuccinocarboxamide synthase [bacterium]|nr:phosphoribosylaminoimidazolesuccinocarboxamide synthase [bacterium]